MIEPEDFGLGEVATLAHVADGARSSQHGTVWKAWQAAVFSGTPRLAPRSPAESDPSDPSATHQFESALSVRIGCGLAMPRQPRAGVVVLHGYEGVPALARTLEEQQGLVERGAAVLAVRVRGFPGSQADCPRLAARTGPGGGGEWIVDGLEEPASDRGLGCAWALAGAVADATNAVRALRDYLVRHGVERPPVFVRGESFGGGLAVLAAGALADRGAGPDRLAIGLPSLGDWAWRLAQQGDRCGGTGRVVRRFITDHREREDAIVALLRAFDSAVAARRVRCPVLCKLALRDDAVPAPAAAAVYNALGTDPGLKWRFVTRYGHFDGGLADLRRHAEFERMAEEFLDPSREPVQA
ncbi:MAG: acetylxylan esterase [Phycisphaerae bacterium]|nr:acetylxylan esterase [Phycisphaerae bacterium]